LLLKKIEGFLKQGYKRIKIKIKPGFDYDFLKEVRKRFPDLPIMADANSAFNLSHLDLFKKIDELNLMMIEQPLSYTDIFDHAKLQKEIKTPICLDESIHNLEDAKQAIELGSCKIINIKLGRVGGIMEAIKIHDLCKENDIPVWCGGMHEYGIGRAHNVAINSLDNFKLPGDVSGSDKYYHEDIIDPEFIINDGTMEVPKGLGIGVQPKMELIDKYTVKKLIFKA
jgi:O-succinylbenzoate synthase